MKLTMNGHPSEVARLLNSLGDNNHVSVTVEDAYMPTPVTIHPVRRAYRKTAHKTPGKLVSAKAPTTRSQIVREAAKGYWAKMTPAERIAEMAARREKGLGLKKQGV